MSSNEDMDKVRRLPAWLDAIVRYVLMAIPLIGIVFILDIPSRLGMPVMREQYYGLFFALAMPCVFWLAPAFAKNDSVKWYDHVLALASFAA